jgi:hypothetical protein
MSVTGGGTRDLFFFLPSLPDDVAIEQLVADVGPEVDYSFEVLEDPAWQPYRDMPGEDDGSGLH